MNVFLLPKSLNPNGNYCRIKIWCDTKINSIRWCAKAEYPKGLVSAQNGEIKISKNGSYYVEVQTPHGVMEKEFRIGYLKAFHGFDGGDGTADDPYLISSCVQFNAIRLDLNAHYRIIADIDFKMEMKNISWIPIGNYSQRHAKIDFALSPEDQYLGYYRDFGFIGELDGNGHTISGITCSWIDRSSVGLFGSCGKGAYIHHLKIEDALFECVHCNKGTAVGSISGMAFDARIEWCSIKSKINTIQVAGGVVGEVSEGTTCRCCTYTGEISALAYYGETNGIFGSVSWMDPPSRIEDCLVNANINGSEYCGGIAGNRVMVERCLFCGSIKGNGYVGGIVSGGSLYYVKNCICCAEMIQNTEVKETEISTLADCFVSYYDEGMGQVSYKFHNDVWRNYMGRIMCEDYWLGPNKFGRLNYAISTCKLAASDSPVIAINGSDRDGVSISVKQLHDASFFREIGWDIESIWQISLTKKPGLKFPERHGDR